MKPQKAKFCASLNAETSGIMVRLKVWESRANNHALSLMDTSPPQQVSGVTVASVGETEYVCIKRLSASATCLAPSLPKP